MTRDRLLAELVTERFAPLHVPLPTAEQLAIRPTDQLTGRRHARELCEAMAEATVVRSPSAHRPTLLAIVRSA